MSDKAMLRAEMTARRAKLHAAQPRAGDLLSLHSRLGAIRRRLRLLAVP